MIYTPHYPNCTNAQHSAPTYAGLDVMKFIMALCVVMIHVIAFNPGWTPGPVVEYMILLAVPFFFVASGFLLQHKIYRVGQENSAQVVSGYAKRIWKMYVCWIIIYLPLSMIGKAWEVESHTWGQYVFIQMRSALMLGEVSYSYPTWFLYSLGFAVAFLYVFIKKRLPLWVLFVVGIGGIGLQYLSYHLELTSTIANSFHSLSRITLGSAYVLIGMMLRCHQHMIRAISVWAALVVSVAMYAMGLPFSELVGSYAIFGIASMIKVKTRESLFLLARGESLWIFLIHMYILTPLVWSGTFSNPWAQFAVASMVSILLSGVLYLWSQRESGRMLKKLV